jgi:hypothetical protein
VHVEEHDVGLRVRYLGNRFGDRARLTDEHELLPQLVPNAAREHGSYQRAAGDIYLDLTALTGTQAAPVVSATTGFGSVT